MRAIGALVAVIVLVAAVVFFADNPGRVEILWQGWQVETSIGVLVAAATLAALAVAVVLWTVSRVLGSPRAFLRSRRERRRRAGYRAVTKGMVAVAAGDPHEAQRYARKADTLLADPPLTLLLSAQAAQLGGDETAATRFFTEMLARPETEFLGVRGLLNQALHAGDAGAARRLADRAVALRPNARWAVLSLFDLETREGRWEAARETLSRAERRRMIPPERARHHQGVIRYELSLAALARGDRQQTTALAAQAQSLAPDLAVPALHHARLLLDDRRPGRAAKAVERAWRTAPHPELAQLYGAIREAEAPIARVKSFERLAAQNPAARDSHLAVAEAALQAQLWGEAREHLERALAADPPPSASPKTAEATALAALPPEERPLVPIALPAAEGRRPTRPTARLCLMMARLEEAEHGDFARTREWLDRAVKAPPDPCYVCASCGGESIDWRSLCPHCGAFDALAWRTPARAVPGRARPESVEGRPVADAAPRAEPSPASAADG